eukprot:285422_1
MSVIDLLALFATFSSAKIYNDVPMVQLTAYIENCCYSCQHFFNQSFYNAYHTKGWTEMTNISFIPYGKCNETMDFNTNTYSYSCQHGPWECKGNMWMACAIKNVYAFNNTKYIPFVSNFMYATNYTVAHNNCTTTDDKLNKIAQSVCNNTADCNWNTLSQCYNNETERNQVYHEMALIQHENTKNVDWVPWIVLNGMHSDSEQQSCENNVLNCTCAVYQGSNPACS